LIIDEDNGTGIPAGRIDAVKQPFIQVGDRLARTDAGISLSLPLASKFAEMHEADITIKNTEGVGTRVTVTFPAARLVAREEIADATR
jgi:signal transduction histidine kinase